MFMELLLYDRYYSNGKKKKPNNSKQCFTMFCILVTFSYICPNI